jgi:hypothetical protein
MSSLTPQALAKKKPLINKNAKGINVMSKRAIMELKEQNEFLRAELKSFANRLNDMQQAGMSRCSVKCRG